MLCRCYEQRTNRYHRYGGRGIRVCLRWHIFQYFYDDMYTSFCKHVDEHNGDTQLDRINNDDHYYPDNCQWLTGKENVSKSSFGHTVHGSVAKKWDVFCCYCHTTLSVESTQSHFCRPMKKVGGTQRFNSPMHTYPTCKRLLGDLLEDTNPYELAEMFPRSALPEWVLAIVPEEYVCLSKKSDPYTKKDD